MAQKAALNLLQDYRARLEAGAMHALASERQLYALHVKAADDLGQALAQGSFNDILRIVASERRAFGWSFLSGSHGAAAESAFTSLATELEDHRQS
jgi:hypothetical protein